MIDCWRPASLSISCSLYENAFTIKEFDNWLSVLQIEVDQKAHSTTSHCGFCLSGNGFSRVAVPDSIPVTKIVVKASSKQNLERAELL